MAGIGGSVRVVSVTGAVLIVDGAGKIAHASDPFCRVTGFEAQDLVGQPMRSLGLDQRLAGELTPGTSAGEIKTRNGQMLAVSLRVQAATINGAVAQIITIVNATPSQPLSGPVFYDVATQGGDRSALAAPALGMIAGALRTGGRVAFAKMRLDRLQDVNQTVGYEIGDAILHEAIERIRDLAPPDAMVARLATNQFSLVAQVGGMRPEVDALAQGIHQALSEPYRVRGATYRLPASVGVAVFPVHGSDLVELEHASDLALREARQRGGDRIELFSTAFHDRLGRELRLDRALTEAQRRDEFDVHYQPVMNLEDESLLAAEALLRWNHSELGRVSPAEFIPRAEATGLILPIGNWVLHRAFRDAKNWETLKKDPPRVGVNLSAIQFGQDNLVQTIEDALSDTKLAPERVDIELTEHSLAGDPVTRNEAIAKLRSMGLTVSIDDFGTGYSSLSQLVDCPVDRLKIDQSFVSGLVHNQQSVTIVRTIIEMARSLNLDLAAEGTERKEQIDFLRDAGCSHAQGHYFYPALPVMDFKALLGG